MALERTPDRIAAGHIPQADRVIRAAGGQRLPVRAEGHTKYPILVTFQRIVDRLTRFGIPQDDCHVGPGRRDQLAIGAERDGIHFVGVPGQRGHHHFAGRNVP
jgi:hypothetical protein